MSYKKQNFESGQKLYASQLNHIEEGIVELSEEIGDFTTAPFTANNNADKNIPVMCYPIAGSALRAKANIVLFQDFNENP